MPNACVASTHAGQTAHRAKQLEHVGGECEGELVLTRVGERRAGFERQGGLYRRIGRFRGDGQPRKPLVNGVRLLIHTGTSADEGEPKSPQRSGELGLTSIAIDGIDRDRLYDDAIV